MKILIAIGIGDRANAGFTPTAVTILCAHVAFCVYGLESDTIRYMTVVKGVERCRRVREISHGLKSKFSPVESEFEGSFVNRAEPF